MHDLVILKSDLLQHGHVHPGKTYQTYYRIKKSNTHHASFLAEQIATRRERRNQFQSGQFQVNKPIMHMNINIRVSDFILKEKEDIFVLKYQSYNDR